MQLASERTLAGKREPREGTCLGWQERGARARERELAFGGRTIGTCHPVTSVGLHAVPSVGLAEELEQLGAPGGP
jgi:hypothetical protein